MSVLWELVLKVGIVAIDWWFKDKILKERMKANFTEFVLNNKARTAMTLEMKKSAEAQLAELRRQREEREKQNPA